MSPPESQIEDEPLAGAGARGSLFIYPAENSRVTAWATSMPSSSCGVK